MRLIDADALLRCIPAEEIVSRMAVANAPTIEPEQWIPCSERLPEDDDEVIVTIIAIGGICKGQRRIERARLVRDSCKWVGDLWVSTEVNDYPNIEIDRMAKVIAWMPMPKPYEE